MNIRLVSLQAKVQKVCSMRSVIPCVGTAHKYLFPEHMHGRVMAHQ